MDLLIDTIFVVFGVLRVFGFAYLTYAKLMCKQIKVETWKQKHETAKWNYLNSDDFKSENLILHHFHCPYYSSLLLRILLCETICI
jgi:hypothetical protein